MSLQRLEVLFCRDVGKKRKVYSDGILGIIHKGGGGVGGGGSTVILYDNNGKELQRKIVMEENIKEYQIGNEIILNHYLIQIEKEFEGTSTGTTGTSTADTVTDEEENKPLVTINTKKFLPKFNTKKSFCQSHSTLESSSGNLQIDVALLRVMREHQVEAANFILNCFNTTTPSPLQNEIDEDDHFFLPRKPLPGTELMRGAILADDMGLGKTLTAISVLWAYLKGGRCKGLIICPSSLVENWEKEIRKWMGVRIKPMSLRSGPQAAATVNTFRVGHPNMTPVLILSYEMFRKHAVTLNSTPLLDIMICDEAHRLKNVTGTKTMNALSSCKASKRLVLTGTPIQNRLSELYAILQFVCPNTSQIGLGSLSAFKHVISDPLDRVNRAQASGDKNLHPLLVEAADRAKETLNKILQRVMIRRGREEVLRKLLPPRREYILKFTLTERQNDLYNHVSGIMKDEWDKDVGRDTSTYLLPGLQKLRQICNYAPDSIPFEEKQPALDDCEEDDFIYEESRTKKRRTENSTASHMGQNFEYQRVLQSSSKLQLLDSLIQTVCDRRLSNPNGDYGKIVVVSNFTSMLDMIESLALLRNWPCLRLDGSVLSEKRISLVDRFNRSADPSLLFLLSSKAGGVGLNLIGANRLVMVDCDWNPSIDAQAMARIWREGQERPVYVYRLIASDRIEEAIYQRQRVKEGLHSVLSIEEKRNVEAEEKENEDDQCEEESGDDEEPEDISPWLTDIWSLVWPSGQSTTTSSSSVSSTRYGDDLLDYLSQTCPQVLTEIVPIES